jgi:hypothetical protein
LTLFCYGQKSTLLENVNYRAKELKQSLSKNGDSLILIAERKIYKVEIYNSSLEKLITVEDTEVKIPINDLPVGRYVVDATLINKHIIMTLLRDEHFEEIKSNIAIDTLVTSTYIKPKVKQPFIDRHANLLSKRLTKSKPKTNTYYWVKYNINNGSTSRRIMRLENQDAVEKLIKKHQLEIKTLKGKHNKLTIWEVYDRTKFIKEQVSNPNYINSSTSGFFNVIPYYTS